MKKFSEYIEENNSENKCHLRNIFIEVNEELRKINSRYHSRKRKDQTHNLVEDVMLDEVEELIEQCDDLLTNNLLNKTIPCTVGIKKYMSFPLKYFIVIFQVIEFNKETFEYDINLITHDKYGLDKDKFEFDESKTDIIFEVKGKYVKQIK